MASITALLGTAVTTTIDNADFLTAGRLEGAEYWFMTTDKAAANIDYTTALARAGKFNIVELFRVFGLRWEFRVRW